MKANLSDFYLLSEAFSRSAVRAEITCSVVNEDIDNWISGNCTKAITLKTVEGRYFRDLVGTTHTLRLISRRVVDELKKCGVTGLATCPVDFRDKRNEVIDGYEVLGVVGRCGPLDKSRSPKVRRPTINGSAMMDIWLGYYFDENSWDGSDMFRPDGTRMTLVTKRTKDLIEGMAATNILFKPILEIEQLVL